MKDIGKVYILGDSYSTFEGLIPAGYASYYSKFDNTNTGLCRAEETWWMQVLSATKSELIQNDSWSGTTICNTGYDKRYCPEDSFIGRLEKKLKNGFFENNTPDTILVFGGTNDNCAESPMGEIKYENYTDDDLRCFLPALCRLIGMLKDNFPKTRIIFMINCHLRPDFAEAYLRVLNDTHTEYIRYDEIDKPNDTGHPGVLGMTQIATGLLKIL